MKNILFAVFALAMVGCGSETQNMIGKGRNKVALGEFSEVKLSRDRVLQSADCPPEDASKRGFGAKMQDRIDQERCYGKNP